MEVRNSPIILTKQHGCEHEVIVTGQDRNSRGYSSAANFRIVADNGRIVSSQMRY